MAAIAMSSHHSPLQHFPSSNQDHAGVNLSTRYNYYQYGNATTSNTPQTIQTAYMDGSDILTGSPMASIAMSSHHGPLQHFPSSI
jgi:hypothetical protein